VLVRGIVRVPAESVNAADLNKSGRRGCFSMPSGAVRPIRPFHGIVLLTPPGRCCSRSREAAADLTRHPSRVMLHGV
jgi:hypothetical protein